MPPSLKERFERKKSKPKKKHLARRVNEIARQVTEMSKECRTCRSVFDPKAPGALDMWHVTVESAGAFLTCPDCFVSSATDTSAQGLTQKID